MKKRVIVVTDGDPTAKRAVEVASKKLGLRVISKSAGNPTPHSGKKIIEMINSCPTDPVVVMADDEGNLRSGSGEKALETIAVNNSIELLGVIAVASNAKDVSGIKPDCSITKDGDVIFRPVDKQGKPEVLGHTNLEGDTVDVINEFPNLLVVGVGDIGKMEGRDNYEFGSPITTKAIEEILKRSGVEYGVE